MLDASIKTLVRVYIYNQCLPEYPEDEWYLSGVGSTFLDALDDAFNDTKHDILELCFETVEALLVDSISVNGRMFFEDKERSYTAEDMPIFELLDKPDTLQVKHLQVARDFLKNSPAYINKLALAQKERQRITEECRKEQELRDKEQLKALLTKYGPTPV